MHNNPLASFANVFYFTVICFFGCITAGSNAQKMVSNNYTSAVGLKRLIINRSMIYEPNKEWMYSHHPYITFFNNKFIAAWSNG